MKARAFTLIELLVVIAIIALLMAVLMPALRLARQQGATGMCLSNTKNLSLGWYMYMGDNDGRIMSANDSAREGSKYVGWVRIPRDENGNEMSNTQSTPPVTDADEIRGIELGLLFPYVNNADAYHCPASKFKSMYDSTRVFVSYGVPRCLYGNPGDRLQISNYNKISAPSKRYVFVESGETRNWNSGHHFVMAAPEYTNLNQWGWWGPMAVNHGNSSVLGFCDGHADVRKWRDRYTIERVDKLVTEGATTYGHSYPPPEQTLDIEYMAAGWPYRHKVQ